MKYAAAAGMVLSRRAARNQGKRRVTMRVLSKPKVKGVEETKELLDEVLRGRERVLEVLERAAEESDFLARMADNPDEALAEYYTLTSEEKAALASGDINKIEAWVGKLDERLATWLWCRLSQEKW
jgi:hypothetical protein